MIIPKKDFDRTILEKNKDFDNNIFKKKERKIPVLFGVLMFVFIITSFLVGTVLGGGLTGNSALLTDKETQDYEQKNQANYSDMKDLTSEQIRKMKENVLFSDQTPAPDIKETTNEINTETINELLQENPNKNIALNINLENVPSSEQEIKAQEVTIEFSSLNTNVRINNKETELRAEKPGELKLKIFDGKIILNELDVSLQGQINELQVNGVTIKSGELDIDMQKIKYETIQVVNSDIKNLKIDSSLGTAQNENKMTYNLDLSDKITALNFFGSIELNSTAQNPLIIIGTADSMTINGAAEFLID